MKGGDPIGQEFHRNGSLKEPTGREVRVKSYYRVMLGRQSALASDCINNHYIGAGFGIERDLKDELPDEWREFNHAFIPIYQAAHPGKSKIAAGLSCGFLWTVAKGISRD